MVNSLQENLIDLFSLNRLKSYKFNINDDNTVALERYLFNIDVSKALYPLLSVLEVSLRNRLNKAIETTFTTNWLIKEIKQQDILFDNEHKKLLEAQCKLLKKGQKVVSNDDLIAELSLGFWIHLCSKKYKTKLWHKKDFFRIVFADYPNFSEFDKLSKIFPLLQLMLKLRNRVFHHEIVINNPYGIENCYNDLKNLLGYISRDGVSYLDRICDFKEVITKQKP